MATQDYLTGRQKYGRPQGMLWSENDGYINGNGKVIPNGYEININKTGISEGTEDKLDAFIILPDHNRSPIDMKTERLEQRRRMVNGRMRSFHLADKRSISVSWDMLPSRISDNLPLFDPTTGNIDASAGKNYVVDQGAGAVDILDWYENHTGSFFVFLAYDKLNNFNGKDYDRLNEYNEVIEMYISDFSYTVVNRGSTTHDFWNISVSLEEV